MMEGVNSSIIYLIYCKNFCKCLNITPSTTIKMGGKINDQKKKIEYCKNAPISQVDL
jgi:hypothetical protein